MAMIANCKRCNGSGLDPEPPEFTVNAAGHSDFPCGTCAGTGLDFSTGVANPRLPNGPGELC